jgi:hypothetical protein
MRTVYVYKWIDSKTVKYMGTARIPNKNLTVQVNIIQEAFGNDCVWYNLPILDPDALDVNPYAART